MTIKVGINGMGRIGRMVLRSIYENNFKDIKVVHINNRSNSETCSNLIKYDSIHGKFNMDIKFEANKLIIDNDNISFSQHSKLEDINWGELGVDIVFECTGKFNSKEKLETHIKKWCSKSYSFSSM